MSASTGSQEAPPLEVFFVFLRFLLPLSMMLAPCCHLWSPFGYLWDALGHSFSILGLTSDEFGDHFRTRGRPREIKGKNPVPGFPFCPQGGLFFELFSARAPKNRKKTML